MRVRGVLYSALVLGIGLWSLVFAMAPETSVLAADKTEDKAPPANPTTKESNCVRCHLTAGRELTEAVYTFAHSVHDLEGDVSCHDCHGGNTEDDEKAHLGEFGFIGTKLSDHLAKCQECHTDQHEAVSAGPHQWNHQEKLNIRYPLCVDCHGNHDVGNPPAEFSMSLVCSECHRGYKTKFPEYARLTDAHDSLWSAILQWKETNGETGDRVPESLKEDLGAIRLETADIVHASEKLEGKTIDALIEKIEKFIHDLQATSTAKAN